MQDVLGHHVSTVVTQEHLVDDGVGTYLQFYLWICAQRNRCVLCLKAGTVTTEID